MTNSTIKIAFSCDNNWIDKLAVTLVSILKHANKKDSYKFFILDSNISEFSKKKLTEIKSDINFNIEFLKINIDLFKKAPIVQHFKIETYFRLCLPSICSVKKLLYIDVDTIVLKNLAELYNIDLKDYYAAAVEDFVFKINRYDKLSVTKYFNAGVLLLNLDKIREDNLEEQFFDVINNHPELITCVDQCVLNHVFNENILFLEDKFNFQHHYDIKNIQKIYKKTKNNIMILHFVTSAKPWNFDKSWDLNLLYLYYALKTPFKIEFLKNIFERIKRKFEITILLLR